MPSYDYKCDDCGEVREYTHPMSETMDMHYCEACGVGFLHKVFVPTPSVFKGQGWGKMTEYKPKKNV